MSRKWRSWIPAVVIWAWLLVSLALVKDHPWLNTLWNAVWLLVLLVIAIASTIHVFRHRHETGGFVGYRGVPRWVITLFGGDNSK
jgi:hypothetical protein